MPVGWKLQSCAGSCLRTNFSRLIEKGVCCCRLACCSFQKYVNSDPCKERKPCLKWINDKTFLTISDFWSEKHWRRAHVYTLDVFGRHWLSSEDFRLLRESKKMIISSSKIPALPGKKSHAYISEKVSKYILINCNNSLFSRECECQHEKPVFIQDPFKIPFTELRYRHVSICATLLIP